MSIYGDDYKTPHSREPYFIKVHRCLYAETKYGVFNPGFPTSKTEVEIVVPDINNRTKFYKYIVYNHTSCAADDLRYFKVRANFKLHKNLTSNESKTLILSHESIKQINAPMNQ